MLRVIGVGGRRQSPLRFPRVALVKHQRNRESCVKEFRSEVTAQAVSCGSGRALPEAVADGAGQREHREGRGWLGQGVGGAQCTNLEFIIEVAAGFGPFPVLFGPRSTQQRPAWGVPPCC